ncbi:MAG: pyrroline-5-carboxylate reductase [Planctomycetota bacterium]
MLRGKRLAILGVGKMGAALAKGLAQRDLGLSLVGAARRESSRERVEALGIEWAASGAEAVAGADVVVLAVKPQQVPALLAEVGAKIAPSTLVVSIAAGVTTARVQAGLAPGTPVVRVMPNTPSVLGAGMAVLAAGASASPQDLALARELFEPVGRTAVLEEHLMDAVTGLSGSGPAYVYLVIESLAEAGVKVGIPRETSTLLAAQTVLGSARMVLELGEHPALLKDAVTTPAGCTVDGLMELEEGKLRVTLLKAVVKATERARELAPPD